MKAYLYLTLLVVPAVALPAQGGIFGKRSRTDPDKRVPELLYILKGDHDEAKRVAAAAELRDYDPKPHPDMMPVLIDVLENDTRPAVRREVACTLGRLRPIEPPTAQALQKAASADPALRVRLQAWSSLQVYHFSPHTNKPKDPPAPPMVTTTPAPGFSGEPPLADPRQPRIADTQAMPMPLRPSPLPPRDYYPPPRSMPRAQPTSRVVPGQPLSSPTPVPVPVEDGPVLISPQ